MRRRFWLGFATGVLALAGSRYVLIAAANAIMRRAEMAEPRTWTADDEDEWQLLLRDLNGQP